MADVSVGETAPFFELPDQQDYPWSLSGQIELGPVVLVFYRGDWCPYCNGQLASYARGFGEFERRGAQVAGISVDPPRNNSAMVGKLLLPFPLLSDPRGDVAKSFGLWDAGEGVAVPAVVVVDRPGRVRYLFSGEDPIDRPADEEIFAALDRIGRPKAVERVTGGPELRVTGAEARNGSVRRRDRSPMGLDQMIPYYQGAYFATTALGTRFGRWGRSGRRPLREVTGYGELARRYAGAIEETIRLQQAEG